MSVDSKQASASPADSRAQESRALLSDSTPEHARFCAVRRMLVATLREWLARGPAAEDVRLEVEGACSMLRQVADNAQINANVLAQRSDFAIEETCPGQLELRQGTGQTMPSEGTNG